MGDMNLLRAQIDNSGMTMTKIASKCDMKRETLYSRINGDTEFKASEIVKIADVLRLTDKERDAIFFKRYRE